MVKHVLRIATLLLCILSYSTTASPDNGGIFILEEPLFVVRESLPRTREVIANVSAYTASEDECGKSDGITASGIPVEDGHIASDDLPFGTRVIIQGRTYTVTDRFGGGYRDRIDIFMASRGEALRFGRQILPVHIIEE